MLENKLASTAFSKLDQFLEGALDNELKSVIRRRSIVGGLCMAIPLWGFETIIYIIALWGTYSKIAKISTVPFKDNLWANIGGAVVVNIIVGVVGGIVLDTLAAFTAGLTIVISFVLGFASITISGMAYIKTLKSIHGKKVKTDIDFQKGFEAMKSGSGVSRETSETLNKFGEYIDVPGEIASSTNPSVKVIEGQVSSSAQETAPMTDLASRLRALKSCYDDGLITKEEFEARKHEILHS